MQLAITAPELLHNLTVIGSLAAYTAKQREYHAWVELVQKQGIRA
jgi:hypothetical protein